jgi:hypothetical protein
VNAVPLRHCSALGRPARRRPLLHSLFPHPRRAATRATILSRCRGRDESCTSGLPWRSFGTRIRKELGFGAEEPKDTAGYSKLDYGGARFSLGYPACPDMEDRRKVTELLKPERMGVILSDELMLHPEQSTDAFVFHHPEATGRRCPVPQCHSAKGKEEDNGCNDAGVGERFEGINKCQAGAEEHPEAEHDREDTSGNTCSPGHRSGWCCLVILLV